MLAFIVVVYSVYAFVKIYISVMQIGFVNQEKRGEPVLMGAGRYMVSGNYAVAREKLSIVSTFVDYLLFVWWVTYGFAWLQGLTGVDESVWSAMLFVMGFVSVNYVVSLPIDIYSTFVVDQDFGFNHMSFVEYIQDQIKQMTLFGLLGGAAFAMLAWIIIEVSGWWLWGFVLLFAIALGANLLMPYFMGLFYKFSPLEEGELRDSIEQMMSDAGLQSDGIFAMNASKKSGKLNAFFAGLGKAKRVVLFDTLLEKLSDQELLAVLGHELGHFRHGDIWKNIAMVGVLLFVAFFVFGHIPDSVYIGMGSVPTAGAKIALLFLLMPLLGFVFTPLMSYLSRHNEYAADEYGAEVGGKEHLVSALLKLVTENKSFPKSHPLVIFFYHTHPPVIERLRELGYDASGIDLDGKLPDGGIFTFIQDDQ